MSAEPPNPSGLPGRNRPHLSDLSRETTEEDLWNLDDEATAQPIHPRQPKPAPPAPTGKESVPILNEPTGNIEPPMPRGLNSPVKRPTARPAHSDEIGELDEESEAPEPTLPPRATASSTDEVIPLTSAIDEVAAPAKVKPAPKAPEPAAPAPAVVAKPVESAPAPPAVEYESGAPEVDQDLIAKTAARENRPRANAPAARASLPRPRLNRREVIGIASFAVVAMIASVWVLTRFFTLLSFTRDSDNRPSYPLKGELAQIASGSTFWREPVRSGESRDVARREVVIIPVLELTLDPANSGGGSLRVIFRNSEGEPLGDPITRSFGAGRFEASGNATVTFAATDGFTKDGDFQGYRTGRSKLWTADILEGPPGGTPANAFKKLSSIPILPERR